MPFGANLKNLLVSKGMSVPELAKRTGINKNTLYSYLRRDTKKVDPAIIKKLVEVLGEGANILYDWDDITEMIWDDMPKNVSPMEEEIVLKWRGLDRHGMEAVKAILDIEYSRCMSEIEDDTPGQK